MTEPKMTESVEFLNVLLKEAMRLRETIEAEQDPEWQRRLGGISKTLDLMVSEYTELLKDLAHMGIGVDDQVAICSRVKYLIELGRYAPMDQPGNEYLYHRQQQI